MRTLVGASRSGAIDAVRVVGVLAVVAGHTLASPLVRPLFFTWHVPLFFFLAGYFWSARRSVKVELAKRARTLALPYLTWFVLIAIVFIAFDLMPPRTAAGRLLEPFANGQHSVMPLTTFWFVSVLFFSVVLLRFLQALPRTIVLLIAVAGLILGYWAGYTLSQTPLSIGSALPCLIFILLGSAAKHLRPRIHRPAMTGLALLLISAVLIISGASAPLDIKQGNFGTPVISAVVAVMISFGLVLSAETVFSRLSGRASGVATRISYTGFMVVLVHPLILWIIITFAPGVPSWIIFIAAAVVPMLLALALLRTNVSIWFTGASRVTGVERSSRTTRPAK